MPILTLVALIAALTLAVVIFMILNNHLRAAGKPEVKSAAVDSAATAFDISLSRRQQFGNRLLGLDAERAKLLFLENSGRKVSGYLIELDEVKSCTVEKSLLDWKVDESMGTKDVALQVQFKDGASAIRLPFYRYGIDSIFDLHERIRKALEWQAIISDSVSKKAKAFSRRTFHGRYPLGNTLQKRSLGTSF